MDAQVAPNNPGISPIAQVNYESLTKKMADAQQQAQRTDPDREIYNRIAEKFAIHPTLQKKPANYVAITQSTQDPANEYIRAFTSHPIPIATFSIADLVKKILFFSVSASPVLLIIVGFVLFMMENKFNVGMTSVYPAWAAEKVETLVREVIIPITK
jgi:hypothetical protein